MNAAVRQNSVQMVKLCIEGHAIEGASARVIKRNHWKRNRRNSVNHVSEESAPKPGVQDALSEGVLSIKNEELL